VFQDKEDPSLFSLLEVYRDMQARNLHLNTSYLLKFRETLNAQGMLTRNESNQVNLLFPNEIKE